MHFKQFAFLDIKEPKYKKKGCKMFEISMTLMCYRGNHTVKKFEFHIFFRPYNYQHITKIVEFC